jgi:Histidine kinase-, DNA gyrase B-, and HSP90-like ATPase
MTLDSLELRRAGRVVYGERAFGQDAHEAMRGDIIRGLIELITNSDDAYAKLGNVHGKLRIEIEHRRGTTWRVIVRDRAIGMTQVEMRRRIIELGGRTSGFETGQAVRGNQGRGAKDLTAFGPVLFESIKNDDYAVLRLQPNGDYEEPARTRRATSEDRRRLGISRANGTVVTVTVRDSIRCPNHGTLKKKLSSHFQLRDIMVDRDREVVLVNLNTGEEDRLHFQLAEREMIRSANLAIEGYPEVTASLTVRRLPERCEDVPADPYRLGGILIKGGRAIYENTLFSFEGNPHAGFLYGALVCEHIDTLARDYDDRRERKIAHATDNPIPIIGRARDGLRHEHPFYVGLRQAAETVLREIINKEEERIRRAAAQMENENTRRNLDRLAREAARFMEEELRNAEAEELPGGPGKGAVKPLAIIPSEGICYLGEGRTLTVVASREGLTEDSAVSVMMDPEGVVELRDGTTIPLRPHRRRDDVLVGQLRIQPLVPELTLIQAEIQGRIAEALIEVHEERTPPPRPEPPEALEFERPRYRIGWTKTKALTLRAPREICEAGSIIKVSSDTPGIVVLTDRVPMEFNVQLGCVLGTVHVEGRALGASGTIYASFENFNAQCRAFVARDEQGPRLLFKLEDKDGGKYRALWEEHEDPMTGDRIQILEIMGKHPALRRYLGEPPDFPGQNTYWAKLIIGEIIADNVCREIARRVDALRNPDERPDSEGFYAEHYSRMLRLLPRFHELMLPTVPALELIEKGREVVDQESSTNTFQDA